MKLVIGDGGRGFAAGQRQGPGSGGPQRGDGEALVRPRQTTSRGSPCIGWWPTPDTVVFTMSSRRTASLITLGCARNEVDSEELAARLEAAGWQLGDDDPDVVVVNTCGFIDAAKKDSIDTLLAAADSGAKVVAAGCMAERYGNELADALPEASAVLSFDDYADIGGRLDDVARRPLAQAAHPARPPHPAAHLPGRARRRAQVPHPRPRGPARRGRPRQRPARAAQAARREPGGPAQARLRLRPALHVLRDPGLPRRLRLPRPDDLLAEAAGWPTTASASSSWSARTPPPTARTWATCGAGEAAARAGRRRGHRAGAGQLPAARRAAAGPDRGDRAPPRASPPTSTCPSSTPAAPCCAGCGASATPSASSTCWTPIREHAPGGGRALQLHRRLPRRDRGGLRRAGRLPGARPGWT